MARAVVDSGAAALVDLVVSRSALGKADVTVPSLAHRMEVLTAVATSRPWLGARLVDAQLLVDVAGGYDALVVGADKWAQLVDPAWYGSVAARDEALARLPEVLVVSRPPSPDPPPDPRWRRLQVDADQALVSSSAVRAGRTDWMLPEAAAWDARWHGWSDPDAYVVRLASAAEGSVCPPPAATNLDGP